MDISPDNSLLRKLQIENFANYLEVTNWRLVKDAGRLIIFEGYNDIDNNSLEIVLPKEMSAPDANIYLAKAINLLSAISDDSPENIIQKIEFYDRDVLRIRNLETDEVSSISLQLAATQVPQLKQLVIYSACSEENLKPHYNSSFKLARQMAEKYRFGHTFNGSFGYTVQSPLIGEPVSFIQKSMNTIIEDMSDKVILPFERRVMERIVRGFMVTREAIDEGDWKVLVNRYAEGFNANMCRAIVRMGADKKSPLDCSIAWSSKLRPSSDLDNTGTIRINTVGYDYLAQADSELSASSDK